MIVFPDLETVDGRLAWVVERLPHHGRAAPKGWRLLEITRDGCSYRADAGHCVIVSGARQSDGKRWLHLSVSLPGSGRYPTWSELEAVKTVFLGKDTYAVSVIPPVDKYVRIHPWVMHLFVCVDGYPLPEFSGVLPDGRRTI